MQIKHLFIFAAMASGIAPAVAAESALPVYLDKTKPIEQRVEDALSRMTLEEKVALCHAQGKFSSPGVRRLGIPEIWMSDGPHGVRAEINWNDWGGAHDTRQAALNGLDIEIGSFTNGLTSESDFGYNDYYLADPYLDMIRKGEVPESTADDKARRILRLIFRTSMNTDKPFGSVATPEHYAAAKKIGDESIVLLKNQGLLPLDPGANKKILVVGENAVRKLSDGGGSSELKAKDIKYYICSKN